ncbi:MAG TPA: ATP-binding cassette domain-containing protein [Bacteroidales bacterium]|nr:ATP-binding cassette domain-containing protein [Bacteroidales bacterium]
MSDILLSVSNASVKLDGSIFLQDVSIDIRKGDFIGIIGPNGGGKTTLVRLMLGLIKPNSGQVKYFIPHVLGKSKIGYLPQVQRFDSKFPITVYDVVLSGLSGKQRLFSATTSADRHKAEHWMESLGIISMRKKPIGQLSGGEMQRVFLCRSLISDPELLILDEPDTYVDNRFEQELYAQLRELNNRMAIVLVSHDVGTITLYIKSIACVNRELHYHPSNIITESQLASYNCPVQIITHGDVPHTVLGKHDHEH